MSLITRSAIIQARVFPSVKEASEQVLWRLGLNMSEAMELFLRRLIVDEKLPFDVIALDEATLRGTDAAVTGQRVADGEPAGTPAILRESEKKFSKTFLRGSTPKQNRTSKRGEKRPN